MFPIHVYAGKPIQNPDALIAHIDFNREGSRSAYNNHDAIVIGEYRRCRCAGYSTCYGICHGAPSPALALP